MSNPNLWFRNLCLFQFAQSYAMPAAEFEAALRQHLLGKCPGGSPSTQGWVPVLAGGNLVEGFDRHKFIELGEKQRLLPAAVVSQALAEKIEDYTYHRGYKPGRKLRMDFKDEITSRLLPQAFVLHKSVRAWLDTERGWLVVHSASVAQAEKLVELLREHMPSLPRIILPDTDVGPQTLMTEWLGRGEAAGRFALDDVADIEGMSPTKATIKYNRIPVAAADEIKRHLDMGKRVTKLGLTWDDRVSFTLTDTLQIKRIRLLETLAEDDAIAEEDPHRAFETEMRLMTSLLRDMLADLAGELRMRLPVVA